jgi:hypothetical protein
MEDPAEEEAPHFIGGGGDVSKNPLHAVLKAVDGSALREVDHGGDDGDEVESS